MTRTTARSLACALVAAAVTATACDGASERFQPLAVGAPVPVYAVRTLGGDSAHVGPGEPLTLLNVWATWCGPCKEEFPDLERLHETYGPRGLRVLAVSVDDGRDQTVEEFVREHGATFVIGRDGEGRVQRLFQTIGVPETFLIAPDGKLLWRHIGSLQRGAAGARTAIEHALAGGSAAGDR